MGDFLFCDVNNFLLRAGDMARERQRPAAVAHVGGPRPWLVFCPVAHPGTRPAAIVQPDGYMEVMEDDACQR